MAAAGVAGAFVVGVAGAFAVEAFWLSPGGESLFGSGVGAAGGADSSGFTASRGAGGGRGGAAVGAMAPGAVLFGGVFRSVAADFGLGFVGAARTASRMG